MRNNLLAAWCLCLAVPTAATANDRPEVVADDQGLGLFDLSPTVGMLTPLGNLGHHEKAGLIYGLALGEELVQVNSHSLYLQLALARVHLNGKDTEAGDGLNLTPISLRADYKYTAGAWEPYLGAGVGAFSWSGHLVRAPSQLKNTTSGSDPGGFIAVGIAYRPLPWLAVAPEFTRYRVWGTFNSHFTTTWLTARIRL